MASLYKKRDIWYMSLMVNNKRITKSLRTKDYSTARSLKSLTETTILQQLNSFTVSNAEISFPELVDRFLKAFGLNLIKQGISIYKVSKLLGLSLIHI